MWFFAFALLVLVLGSFADDGDPSQMAGRSRYSRTRQRTRHETIGALDGFAQHPRAHSLNDSLYGVARFFPWPILLPPISGS